MTATEKMVALLALAGGALYLWHSHQTQQAQQQQQGYQQQSYQAPPVVVQNASPANPWGYNFCGGNLITAPQSGFCSYFNCIASFSTGVGYVVQCGDGNFSKSGGRAGVCSKHGGFARNLVGP